MRLMSCAYLAICVCSTVAGACGGEEQLGGDGVPSTVAADIGDSRQDLELRSAQDLASWMLDRAKGVEGLSAQIKHDATGRVVGITGTYVTSKSENALNAILGSYRTIKIDGDDILGLSKVDKGRGDIAVTTQPLTAVSQCQGSLCTSSKSFKTSAGIYNAIGSETRITSGGIYFTYIDPIATRAPCSGWGCLGVPIIETCPEGSVWSTELATRTKCKKTNGWSTISITNTYAEKYPGTPYCIVSAPYESATNDTNTLVHQRWNILFGATGILPDAVSSSHWVMANGFTTAANTEYAWNSCQDFL